MHSAAPNTVVHDGSWLPTYLVSITEHHIWMVVNDGSVESSVRREGEREEEERE